MKIGILPSQGGSLEGLAQSGQRERFEEFYLRQYTERFEQVYFFSYSAEKGELFPGCTVIGNNWKLHRWLYAFLMPLIHRRAFRQCDLFRVLQFTGEIPAILAKLLYHKPIVATYGYHYSSHSRLDREKVRPLLYRFRERLALIFYDYVIVTTQGLKRYISGFIPEEKILLIPNGVDVTRFKPLGYSQRFASSKILFVGSLTPRKNPFLLLEAVSLLKQKVEVLFVGQGPLTKEIGQVAVARLIPVQCIGTIPHHELPSYYQSADVFVLPSLIEGHPKSLLEAMSCGLPCVGTDVPGTREVIQDGVTGLLCRVDPRDMAEKLSILLDDKDQARALGERARAHVAQHYNLTQLIAKEKELLFEIGKGSFRGRKEPLEPIEISPSEEKMRQLIVQYERENTKHWSLSDAKHLERQESLFNQEQQDYLEVLVHRLEDSLGPVSGKKLLEVGCGTGSLAIRLALKGARVIAIDLNRTGVAIARLRRQRYSNIETCFLNARAEGLPFPEKTFDGVYSFSVLEHIQEIDDVMREVFRVLKENGIFYCNVPNYLFPYEGHYKILWIPGLPKRLGKLYARLRGKDPALLDELNYTNPHRLRSALRACGFTDIEDQFMKVMEQKISVLELQQPFKSVAWFLRRFGWLKRVIWAVTRLGLTPNILMVSRKPKGVSGGKSFDPGQLLEEALRVSRLISGHYVNRGGLVLQEVDAATGWVRKARGIAEDLGDYLQNIIWTGRAAGDKALLRWGKDQVLRTSRQLFGDPGERREKRTVRFGALGDAMVGFAMARLLMNDPDVRESVESFLLHLEKAMSREGTIPSLAFLLAGRWVGFPWICPSYHGNFAEELMILYQATQEVRYRALAEKILGYWKRHPYWEKVGLFPNYWHSFSRNGKFSKVDLWAQRIFRPSGSFSTSEISKVNSNLVSAFLEHHRSTGDPDSCAIVKRWLTSASEKCLHPSGACYSFWDELHHRPVMDRAAFSHTAAFVNLFIDAEAILKDVGGEEISKRICDFWLQNQSDLGLFPENPFSQSSFDRRARLDAQTDFIIVLLKLFHLTGEERYLNAAERCVKGVLQHLKTPYGYIWSASSRTGLPICTNIHVKFIALWIKALLGLRAVLEGENLLTNRELFLLSRDR